MDRTALITEADALLREVLWLRERGRCFVCGKAGTEVAHIFGRRFLRLRWDSHASGNCHLLCRPCHTADHASPANSPYNQVYQMRFGVEQWLELAKRTRFTTPMSDAEIELVVGRLKEESEQGE